MPRQRNRPTAQRIRDAEARDQLQGAVDCLAMQLLIRQNQRQPHIRPISTAAHGEIQVRQHTVW